MKYDRGAWKHKSKGQYSRTIHKQVREKILFLKYSISKEATVKYTKTTCCKKVDHFSEILCKYKSKKPKPAAKNFLRQKSMLFF